MMQDAAPGWLVAEVAEGLQRLLLLRLDGCPPADAAEAVALAWADAVMLRHPGLGPQDAERVRRAFRRLAASAVRWPPPAALADHMPALEERLALSAPPRSPEQIERARAALAQARALLLKKRITDERSES